MRRLVLAALALVLAAAVLPAGPASARIGVASVVKNEVNGTLAGRKRVLQVGTSVFRNEVITTGADSSAQLLFSDETSLTIGAQSQITLDRFVYDPRSKTGDIAVSIGRGAFRFITGSADPRSYKLKTPVATIGIRGTIVEGFLDALGNFIIVVVEGSAIVELADGTTYTLTAGQYLTVGADGTLVAGPADWTGPTLDLDASVKFILDNQGNWQLDGTDPLPQWFDPNDALDSRNLNETFPPVTPSPKYDEYEGLKDQIQR